MLTQSQKNQINISDPEFIPAVDNSAADDNGSAENDSYLYTFVFGNILIIVNVLNNRREGHIPSSEFDGFIRLNGGLSPPA